MKKLDDPTFVVDADGVLITAVGIGSKHTVSIRSDNPEFVRKVKLAADTHAKVNFIYGADPLTAGWKTNDEVLAALLAAAPGRSYVKEAPEDALFNLHNTRGIE
jgi:hypothetical protein